MSIIYIESTTFYVCMAVIIVGVFIMGYLWGDDDRNKKCKEYYDKQLKFKYDDKILRNLIGFIYDNPEKETLDNITELLLIDNISDDSIKLRFIKEAIREYLKKGIGDIT